MSEVWFYLIAVAILATPIALLLELLLLWRFHKRLSSMAEVTEQIEGTVFRIQDENACAFDTLADDIAEAVTDFMDDRSPKRRIGFTSEIQESL